MEDLWAKFMEKLLWALKPVILFINKYGTIPFIKKKVNGIDYYLWQPLLKRGMVLITQTRGEGSNLINPGSDKHGAIYFGLGLRSCLDSLHAELLAKEDTGALNRISKILQYGNIQDHIPYVLESIEQGVVATDLVTFLTHKDRVKVLALNNADLTEADKERFMSLSGLAVLPDLGLPYDYGFTTTNTARYCFELVALGYERAIPGLHLPQEKTLGHYSYRSTSFTESKDFVLILDSDSN